MTAHNEMVDPNDEETGTKGTTAAAVTEADSVLPPFSLDASASPEPTTTNETVNQQGQQQEQQQEQQGQASKVSTNEENKVPAERENNDDEPRSPGAVGAAPDDNDNNNNVPAEEKELVVVDVVTSCHPNDDEADWTRKEESHEEAANVAMEPWLVEAEPSNSPETAPIETAVSDPNAEGQAASHTETFSAVVAEEFKEPENSAREAPPVGAEASDWAEHQTAESDPKPEPIMDDASNTETSPPATEANESENSAREAPTVGAEASERTEKEPIEAARSDSKPEPIMSEASTTKTPPASEAAIDSGTRQSVVAVKEEKVDDTAKVLVLSSHQTLYAGKSDRACMMLKAKKIPFVKLIGDDPSNQDKCSQLFQLAGVEQGCFPLFFIVPGGTSSSSRTTFFGDFDKFQTSSENGTLVADIGIPTLAPVTKTTTASTTSSSDNHNSVSGAGSQSTPSKSVYALPSRKAGSLTPPKLKSFVPATSSSQSLYSRPLKKASSSPVTSFLPKPSESSKSATSLYKLPKKSSTVTSSSSLPKDEPKQDITSASPVTNLYKLPKRANTNVPLPVPVKAEPEPSSPSAPLFRVALKKVARPNEELSPPEAPSSPSKVEQGSSVMEPGQTTKVIVLCSSQSFHSGKQDRACMVLKSKKIPFSKHMGDDPSNKYKSQELFGEFV